jgi:glucoamylase
MAEYAFWWPQAAIGSMPVGARLVVALPEACTVRWGINGWNSVTDTPPVDTGLGFYATALDTTGLPAGTAIDFTWRGQDGEWAGRNWRVEVTAAPQPAASSTTLQAAPRVAK